MAIFDFRGCRMNRLIERYWETATASPEKIVLLTEKSQMSNSDLLSLVHVLDMQLSSRGVGEGETMVLTSTQAELCIAFSLLISLRSHTGIFCSSTTLLNSGIEFDRALTTAPIAELPSERQLVIEGDWFSLLGSTKVPEFRGLGSPMGQFVVQTSGSTGLTKFISVPEAEKLRDMVEMDQHAPEDFRHIRLMSTASPGTGWALNKYLPVLFQGGSVVALSEELDRSLQYIDLYGVTHLSTTPALLLSLLNVPNAAQYLGSLREIEVAGAYAPQQLLSRVAGMCPKAQILTAYGASEVGALTRAKYESLKTTDQAYLGEIFRKDLALEILTESGDIDRNETSGLLAVRLPPGHGRHYLRDETTDGTTGFTETHFLTGDLVRRERDSLFYKGRNKNILNLNANKYSLDQIGQLLTSAFTETEFVPIAYRDDDGLEQLGVFYSGAKPISLAAVNSVLAGRWSLLSAASLWEVPEMPRTLTGKVNAQTLVASLDSENQITALH